MTKRLVDPSPLAQLDALIAKWREQAEWGEKYQPHVIDQDGMYEPHEWHREFVKDLEALRAALLVPN